MPLSFFASQNQQQQHHLQQNGTEGSGSPPKNSGMLAAQAQAMQAFNTAAVQDMGMQPGLMQHPFVAPMHMQPGMDMGMQSMLHSQQQMQPGMPGQYGAHMPPGGMMAGMYGDGEEGIVYDDYDALALQMQQLQLQQQLQMQLQQHDIQGMMPTYQQVRCAK
jgi:hypothetical protein